jgi:vacuolar-type H+-ATPase subunit E/Vma4
MALEDILRAIEREADEELTRTLADAEREIDAITDRVRGDAARAQEEVRRDRRERDRVDVERILLRARADAGRSMREGREGVYAGALERARSCLAAIRRSPTYSQVFRSLLDESLANLADAEVVQVDPRDVAIAEQVRSQRSLKLCIAPDIETWGGVVVRTADGRAVRNTLEERLERADPFLRPVVASIVPGMAPWEREAEG